VPDKFVIALGVPDRSGVLPRGQDGSVRRRRGNHRAGPDAAAQSREVFRRIEIALGDVGAVHAEVLGTVLPVATMVEVSALIDAELYVEIEVDAYLSD
jgi:hypothetical protein